MKQYRYHSQACVYEDELVKITDAFDTAFGREVSVTVVNLRSPTDQQIKELQEIAKTAQCLLFKKSSLPGQPDEQGFAKFLQVDYQPPHKLTLTSQKQKAPGLLEIVKKESFLDQNLCTHIGASIAHSLSLLHQRNLVHNYINLDNVQLSDSSQGLGCFQLSLKHLVLKSVYLSPQFRNTRQRTLASDVYGLGVLMYKLMYGVFPYQGESRDPTKPPKRREGSILHKGLPLQITIDSGLARLVQRMIDINPQTRPIIAEILSELGQIKNRLSKDKEVAGPKKLKRFPPEIEAEYMVFKDKRIVDRNGYSTQVTFTALHRDNRRLAKVHIVSIDKDQNDADAVNRFVKFQVPFFKQAKAATSKIDQVGILSMYRHFLTASSLILMFQYYNQGPLADHIQIPRPIQSSNQIMYYLGKAVQFYNSQRGAYWWLSPESVFVSNGNCKLGHPVLELRTVLASLKDKNDSLDYLASEKKVDPGRSSFGDKTADCWSLAVLAYRMMTGHLPKEMPIAKPAGMESTCYQSLDLDPKNRPYLTESQLFPVPDLIGMSTYYGVSVEEAMKRIEQRQKQHRKVSADQSTVLITEAQEGSIINLKTVQMKESVVDIQAEEEQSQIDKLASRSELDWLEKFMYRVCIHNRALVKRSRYFEIIKFGGHSWIKTFAKASILILGSIFLFYLPLLFSISSIFYNQSSLIEYSVPVSLAQGTFNYTVVTPDSSHFQGTEHTISSVRDQMNCANALYFNPVDGGNRVQVRVYFQSNAMVGYLAIAVLCMVGKWLLMIAIVKRLDLPHIICKAKSSAQNIDLLVRHLLCWLGLATWDGLVYLIYGWVFYEQVNPCVTNPLLSSGKRMLAGLPNYHWLVYVPLVLVVIVLAYLCLKNPNTRLPRCFSGLMLLGYVGSVSLRVFNHTVDMKYPKGYYMWVHIMGLAPETGHFIIWMLLFACDFGYWLFKKTRQRLQRVNYKLVKAQSTQQS